MKAKAALSAISLFRVLVFLIPILLMPTISEAKQKVTVGGKTVVVDDIRLSGDQFEITYNGRVLKGPANQLSAVIAAIAIHEQKNNRNQEVPKPKKKKRSKLRAEMSMEEAARRGARYGYSAEQYLLQQGSAKAKRKRAALQRAHELELARMGVKVIYRNPDVNVTVHK